MKISLITPSFNQNRYIGRTICSVLDQRGDFDLEFIILDGGSTDGTLDTLRSFGDRIEWVSRPDDGQVAAINEGFRKATGDVVGWLNSDDLLLEGALGTVADTFRQNQSCDWVFGDCIIIDEDDREIRKLVSAYKRYHAKRYSRSRLLTRNFISQMTVFWKRELLDQIGLLDGSFSLAFDYDYWLRLSEKCEPLYVDRKLAAFRWYRSSKSGANVNEQMREDQKLAEKHGGQSKMMRIAKRFNNTGRRIVYGCYDKAGSFGRRLVRR